MYAMRLTAKTVRAGADKHKKPRVTSVLFLFDKFCKKMQKTRSSLRKSAKSRIVGIKI